MAKVHFFGTRSGTEPMEGMHHTSLALEVNGVYYFVDAGENCADSSYLSGVDHMKIKAVFITHPHMDHTGGLAGLFWNVRKLTRISDRRPIDGQIQLFMSDLRVWKGVEQILRVSEADFDSAFRVILNRTVDGLIYEDENVKVTAYHNHHMQKEEGDGWMSYTYVMETEGKKIVFSGDVRDMQDLEAVIGDGCDLLMVETGHHKVLTVGEFLDRKHIGKAIFTHHGREIINDRAAAQQKVDAFKTSAVIAYDGMVEEI